MKSVIPFLRWIVAFSFWAGLLCGKPRGRWGNPCRPEELSVAARIDGCSEWTIFWRVILPLSKPFLATAAVLHFLHAWNDFRCPLLYLTQKETFIQGIAATGSKG